MTFFYNSCIFVFFFSSTSTCNHVHWFRRDLSGYNPNLSWATEIQKTPRTASRINCLTICLMQAIVREVKNHLFVQCTYLAAKRFINFYGCSPCSLKELLWRIVHALLQRVASLEVLNDIPSVYQECRDTFVVVFCVQLQNKSKV